jgi:hypothetical protein
LARKPTPFDLIRPSILMTQMIAEANLVIALRMWGMAGAWKMAPGEKQRMVTEKVAAAQASGLAMAKAALSGATPGEVASAGLKPVRRRTRANAARLTRSAAKLPR